MNVRDTPEYKEGYDRGYANETPARGPRCYHQSFDDPYWRGYDDGCADRVIEVRREQQLRHLIRAGKLNFKGFR